MKNIRIYSPDQQVSEVFPGGSITVQKPIGFPHQDSVVRRVGPLFYWSWAHTDNEGGIGLHPHEGFEIMSYVLNGKLIHGDTLGTESAVGQGGIQVMQTGSGVSHKEKFFGPDGEAFQIWLEPHLSEALKRRPTYADYRHEDFPLASPAPGVSVKTILGAESPIELVTDAKMWDITVEPGHAHEQDIPPGYTWAALAVRGDGTWETPDGDGESVPFRHKDFSVIDAADGGRRIVLRAGSDRALRMAVIELPAEVDYPLYRK
ncbi:pirin family protein [Paenibacillus sacheonensis]|uniref:Pirin n=1 Tax=Paenibacillus sacheonensis TaxID=742054 RepID=A0A7X4YVG8_9BACL|nr:pirin family protein [Paenibacillus sacheonensis]MBM7568513.1 redox-sensitive bicupin YhaK (pirin superfamily) [Paenibacillus sacheonensis]NBC72339.1 pirin [Paenibacillus sacheonensis]